MIQILGRVLIFNSVNQSIPTSVFTPINFDTEITDNADAFDPKINNTKIFINHNYFNLIRFKAKGSFAFAATTSYSLIMRKNGANITPVGVSVSGGSNPDGSSTSTLNLSSYWINCKLNDFFELYVNQNSIGNLNFIALSWLEAELGVY